MIKKNDIAELVKNLKSYFMGELIPTKSAIIGMYDSDAWDAINWCTFYAETHSVVECDVEYLDDTAFGDCFKVCLTEYSSADHKFHKSEEYWPRDIVEGLKNEIVIDLWTTRKLGYSSTK